MEHKIYENKTKIQVGAFKSTQNAYPQPTAAATTTTTKHNNQTE